MRFFEQYFVEKMKKTQKDDNYFEHFQRKGIIKISKKCVRRKILNRLLYEALRRSYVKVSFKELFSADFSHFATKIFLYKILYNYITLYINKFGYMNNYINSYIIIQLFI